MEIIFRIIDCIGVALNFMSLVLDLNFWIVSGLLSIVCRLIAFVYNFPSALVSGLTHCGNTIFLSLATLAETICGVVHSSVQTLTNLYCGVSESFKVFGHLSSHVALRSKELVNRGVMNVAVSGQSLVRQLGDTFGIALSLLAYFINTVINVLLIGTQNLFSAVLAFWETTLLSFLRVSDFVASFLSHLSSSAIAVVILLWTPCQITIDILLSVIKVLLNVLLLNLYGLALMFLILTIGVLYLNPEFTARILDHLTQYMNTVPSLHRIWRDVCQIFRVALRTVEATLNSETWQSLSRRRLQRGNRNARAERAGNQLPNRGAQREAARANEEGQAAGRTGDNGPAVAERRPNQPVNLQGVPGPSQSNRGVAGDSAAPRARTSQASSSDGSKSFKNLKESAADQGSEALPEDTVWSLLKEQEERKMCVICQDQMKTVLLLPCRHLCLCRNCTDILMRQPVYQHNCPLCRQLILQTLDVYL